MACNFSLKAPDGWLIKATETIEADGGSFTRDERSGEFSVAIPALGAVQGTYSDSDGTLSIVFTKKPFLLPCSAIQKFVTRQFGGS